jgi:hypothetical protein
MTVAKSTATALDNKPFRSRPQSTNIHPGGAGFEPFHSGPKTSAHMTGAAVFQQFFSCPQTGREGKFQPGPRRS